MKLTTRGMVGLAVVLAAPALAGCFDGGAATKAGGTGGPVTLRLATDDSTSSPSDRQSRSSPAGSMRSRTARLRIEPVTHAVGAEPDYERRVARLVTSGKLDMGLMPARSWDPGVSPACGRSMRRSSSPATRCWPRSSRRRRRSGCCPGSARRASSGSALLPDGLDHPSASTRRCSVPRTTRAGCCTPTGAEDAQRGRPALGATYVQARIPTAQARRRRGRRTGHTSGAFTGNVTLLRQGDTLVINARVYDARRGPARDPREGGGADARVGDRDDAERRAEARAFCDADRGGQSRRARRATRTSPRSRRPRPVYGELERDPLTRRLIARIRELKQQVGPDRSRPPRAASRRHPAEREGHGGGRRRLPLRGHRPEKLRAGVSNDRGAHGRVHLHVLRWQVLRGAADDDPRRNPVAVPGECSAYALDGDRMIMHFSTDPPVVSRWRLTPRGDLKFLPDRGDSIRRRVARVFAQDPGGGSATRAGSRPPAASPAGRARHPQRAAERLDAVGEALQARAARRSAPPTPSSAMVRRHGRRGRDRQLRA